MNCFIGARLGQVMSFRSVVVITFASHAKGPLKPGGNSFSLSKYSTLMLNSMKNCQSIQQCLVGSMRFRGLPIHWKEVSVV